MWDIALLREEGPSLGGEVGDLILGGIYVELVVVCSGWNVYAGGCRASCVAAA